MKYELTGISTPFGGLSWSKTNSVKDAFAILLIYLESKRILVNPIEMEKKEWCINSVLEMKEQLISIIKIIGFREKDISIIRNMIEACNSYLDEVTPLKLPFIILKNDKHDGTWEDLNFDKAMKEFRKSFRTEIQVIEEHYNLTFNKTIPDEF